MSNTAPTIHELNTPVASVWIAYLPQQNVQYYYGGSRLVSVDTPDQQVEEHLMRLMREESELKNRLINKILTSQTEGIDFGRLPKGVIGSRVGGGRCLIRPHTEELHNIFSNPANPRFEEVLRSAFAAIGQQLNDLDGLVKLTPDFGRFADCSNHLYRHTQHVLGIGCDLGGCGGKSSYSTSGIVGGMEQAGLLNDTSVRTTVIGSAGALGSEIVEHLIKRGFRDLTLCDLSYDSGEISPLEGFRVIPSEAGRFTDEALQRGGMIIAATWGHELENSNFRKLPRGTQLVLAHNLCLPEGELGLRIAHELHDAGVQVIPGALLTLGGALTSRLEWFHRQEYKATPFDKEFAHTVAHKVVSALTGEVLRVSREERISPYAAMHTFAHREVQ
jgi:hypothetical protein